MDWKKVEDSLKAERLRDIFKEYEQVFSMLPVLDSGFKPGELTVFGGRSSQGKSNFTYYKAKWREPPVVINDTFEPKSFLEQQALEMAKEVKGPSYTLNDQWIKLLDVDDKKPLFVDTEADLPVTDEDFYRL